MELFQDAYVCAVLQQKGTDFITVYMYTELQKKRRTKYTILNSPYMYTMKLSIFVMIKLLCSGDLLLLNFL